MKKTKHLALLNNIREGKFSALGFIQPTTYNLQPTTYNLQPTTYNLQPTTYNLQPTTLIG
jgi:hypothetical protein